MNDRAEVFFALFRVLRSSIGLRRTSRLLLDHIYITLDLRHSAFSLGLVDSDVSDSRDEKDDRESRDRRVIAVVEAEDSRKLISRGSSQPSDTLRHISHLAMVEALAIHSCN